MILSVINIVSWVIGGITLLASLVALVIVCISYHKTKKNIDKMLKNIQQKKEDYKEKKND